MGRMRRYFILLNLIGVTVAVFFVVKVFYIWVTQDLTVISSPRGYSETTMDVEKTSPPPSDYQSILKRNLFKTVSKGIPGSGSTATPIGAPLPIQLNVKLWGTVTFSDGKGFAVIEDVPARRQDLFTAGKAIQNATLKEILRGRVILSVNGRDQVLNMEDPKSLPERVQPIPASAPQSTSQQIALSRLQIDDAVQNINELMTQIKIRPHFLDGRPDGIVVGAIVPDSIFSRMGLQNGDIIAGINGEKILSVDDALKLYQGIKSGSSVNIELKRAGKTETLMYQIE